MSPLFTTAPAPCKRNNWLVHLLSRAKYSSRRTKTGGKAEDERESSAGGVWCSSFFPARKKVFTRRSLIVHVTHEQSPIYWSCSSTILQLNRDKKKKKPQNTMKASIWAYQTCSGICAKNITWFTKKKSHMHKQTWTPCKAKINLALSCFQVIYLSTVEGRKVYAPRFECVGNQSLLLPASLCTLRGLQNSKWDTHTCARSTAPL